MKRLLPFDVWHTDTHNGKIICLYGTHLGPNQTKKADTLAFTWVHSHTNANRLKWVSEDVCLTNSVHMHIYRENRGKERTAEGRRGDKTLQSHKKRPRNK